jgi:hypothetical protein
MLVLGVTPYLALRTVFNVFTYNITSSTLSVLMLSYAAFHSLSDIEGTGVRSFVDSAGRAGGSACDIVGG